MWFCFISDLTISSAGCTKCLTPIFLYQCLNPHTTLSNSIPSTQNWYFYPSTNRINFEFYSLEGLSFYRHKKLSNTVPSTEHCSIGLSVYLSTHKPIKLYTLYRAMVAIYELNWPIIRSGDHNVIYIYTCRFRFQRYGGYYYVY